MESVLVVDDSSVARTIIQKCLEILGWEDVTFLEAEHGVKALEVLREQPVDLVVTDLNMPELDGTSLLRRIKASPKLTDTPVIVVSSLVNDEKRKELTDLGAAWVVHKPVSPTKMAEAIAALSGGEET